MKKWILSTAMTATMITPIFSYAQNTGVYVGAGYSAITLDGDDAGLNDMDLSTLNITVGNRISPNFAIEGRFGFGISDDSQNVVVSAIDVEAEVELDNYIGFYAKGIIPVSDKVELYGLIGITKAKATVTARAMGFSATESDTETDPSFGAGIMLNISDNVSLVGEYAVLVEDTTALSIGLQVGF